jgi:GPH family glycoside/pentoside/hexuronide:cation symporter
VARLDNRALAAYAALALPLAMAALPVYVHAPRFYAELGLNLTLAGAILLAVRALDALCDPLLGVVADRSPRRTVIVLATPFIALGLVLLFHPPSDPGLLAWWFAGSLVLTYLGLSAASISYFSIGSALSPDYHERTRITAARGAVSLAGVLLAAALPQFLGSAPDAQDGLSRFSLIFVPLLATGAAVTLVLSPAVPRGVAGGRRVSLAAMMQPLTNARFRRLAAIFLANGIAAAIPATLILFYVADVLQLPEMAGWFLALYFVSGAVGMPVWVRLAQSVGKVRAWAVAMGLSVAAFVWAFVLGEGDAAAFAAVCVLSGLAFGADIALPASLLADVIDRDQKTGLGRPDGAYFGLWHLLEKLALALAAGIALPALDQMGYTPGVGDGTTALATVYALFPCAIKLGAAALLWLAVHELESGNPSSIVKGETA